jgi:hypothetical protein
MHLPSISTARSLGRIRRISGRGAPAAVVALLAIAPSLQACNGCSDTNLVAREPVLVNDDEVAEFDHDWGSWLSMAVNADGAPIVSYYDKTKGALGFATASFDDDGAVSWAHEEVDGYADESGLDSGDRGKYTSMAVAADGGIWIAYQDVQNKTLRWANRGADGIWVSGMADSGAGTSPDAGHWASLALDGSGYPIISHYDAAKGTLRVAHYDAGTASFNAVVVDEGVAPVSDTGEALEADVGMYPSVAVVSGIEYISYYDVANGDLKLAWGGPSSYSIETVASEGDVGQWTNLVVDDGEIHVAYHDVTNQDLMYAVGEPGAWLIEAVDSADHVGADTHLRVVNGVPNIAYFDGRNNDMKSAMLSGESWSARTVTNDPGALGFHNEVVVASGITYAACYDYTNRTLWFSTLD